VKDNILNKDKVKV